MVFEIVNIVIYLLCVAHKAETSLIEQRDQQDLSIDCGSIYQTTVEFPAKTLDVVNISIPNSHNASIRIQSTCCDQIKPSDVSCSPCSVGGERTCFVDQSEVINLHTSIGGDCLNGTVYYFTCHALLCNGSFPPGYRTGCLPDMNETQICQRNGSWEMALCTDDVANVTSTSIPSLDQSSRSQKIPIHAVTSTYGWEGHTFDVTRSQFGTAIMNQGSSRGPHKSTTTMATTDTAYNSTAFPAIDDEEIKKDLMQFLIAFGVVLVVVFVIVCGFFIRKAKKKDGGSDLPLEYWHETEYIESICGKGSCSINPLPNDIDEHKPTGRYAKKDDGTLFRHGPVVDKHRLETTNENVDRPRPMKNDYTDRYVTTATGSHFYSYRTSPDVDLGTSTIELPPAGNQRDSRNLEKMASFKPRYSKKHNRSGKQRHTPDNMTGSRRATSPGSDDIYAVCYKNKLKNSLDDWSAEESDV